MFRKKTQLLTTFAFMNGLLFCLLGLPYLDAILSYQSLLKNTLFDFSTLPYSLLIYGFTLINYVSHMFFLSGIVLLPLMLLILPLSNLRVIGLMLVVSFWLAVSLLLIDVVVFHLFHFHLNQTILGFLFSPYQKEIFDISSTEGSIIAIALCLALAIEILIYVWVVKYAENIQLKVKRYWLYWAVGLLLSYLMLFTSMAYRNNLLTQQVSNLPLYHQVLSFIFQGKNSTRLLYNFSENYFSLPNWGEHSEFHYPKSTLRCLDNKKPFNIVLLTAEALRFDNLERGVMPNLAKLARQEIEFRSHFSASNATQASLFSLFFGIPGSYWSLALNKKTSPALMRVLLEKNYERKIIWSSEMAHPAFHQTIYKGVENLRLTHQRGDNSSDWDRETTARAIHYLHSKQKSSKPFFLHLFYNTTHAYCQENHYKNYYFPELSACQRIGWHSQAYKDGLYNRYKNAARFVDSEMIKIVETLKKQKLYENTIVMVTSDHGEEFNDTGLGYFGHAGNFTKFQLQVPMIIHWPGEKSRKISYPTNHYDISITLLQSALQCQNRPSDYGIGQNLFDASHRMRLLNVSSYAYQGIVFDKGIMVLRRSGEIELQDTMGQPQQHLDIPKSQIAQALKQLRRYTQDT